MGSSCFNQNSDADSLRAGKCTSVPFQTVDKSAYWAVSLPRDFDRSAVC